MTNQDGLLRQAAAETGALTQRSATGSWPLSGGEHCLFVVRQVLGEVLPNASRRELQESELIDSELLKGRRGIRVRKIECRLALLRCDRSNVDQTDDLGIVPGFSNDHASVRVSDEQDWTIFQREGPLHGGDVVGQRCEWCLDRNDVKTSRLEKWNDFRPA
jgi:hypothetical protein